MTFDTLACDRVEERSLSALLKTSLGTLFKKLKILISPQFYVKIVYSPIPDRVPEPARVHRWSPEEEPAIVHVQSCCCCGVDVVVVVVAAAAAAGGGGGGGEEEEEEGKYRGGGGGQEEEGGGGGHGWCGWKMIFFIKKGKLKKKARQEIIQLGQYK